MMEFLARNGFRGLLWSAMLLALGSGMNTAVAQEAPPAEREFREPESAPEPQQIVTIAVYLLIALTVCTVSLLILVMLWGARVRRQARQPLPTTSPTDPLWYLKGKKHQLSEPEKQRDEPPAKADDEDPPTTKNPPPAD